MKKLYKEGKLVPHGPFLGNTRGARGGTVADAEKVIADDPAVNLAFMKRTIRR